MLYFSTKTKVLLIKYGTISFKCTWFRRRWFWENVRIIKTVTWKLPPGKLPPGWFRPDNSYMENFHQRKFPASIILTWTIPIQENSHLKNSHPDKSHSGNLRPRKTPSGNFPPRLTFNWKNFHPVNCHPG